jgi:hypothetical protein
MKFIVWSCLEALHIMKFYKLYFLLAVILCYHCSYRQTEGEVECLCVYIITKNIHLLIFQMNEVWLWCHLHSYVRLILSYSLRCHPSLYRIRKRVALIFVDWEKHRHSTDTGHWLQMKCQSCRFVAFDKTFSLLRSCCYGALQHAVRFHKIHCRPSIYLYDLQHWIRNCFVCWAIFMCLIYTGKSLALQKYSTFVCAAC